MKQFSTLKKLAEELGLSVSTVSRALKDHPDISAATVKRVKELAALSEYEPNTFALNLRTNKSKILGVIVPYIQNLFYEYFIAALNEEVRKDGYSLLVLQSGESTEAEIKNLDIMRKNRVDGLFISLTENTEEISPFLKLTEIGIPTVFFDRVPLSKACDKISFADSDVGALAAKRLIKSKKKHVLCLYTDNPHLGILQKRLRSFRNVFRKESPKAKLDIHFHSDMKEAERITRDALARKDPPDAIFCIGDNSMIWAMKAIQKKGLKIPGDIGILCISNGFIPTLYNPMLTHVETNGYKLGKLAFARLKEIFAGKTFIREIVMDAVLVEGGSL